MNEKTPPSSPISGLRFLGSALLTVVAAVAANLLARALLFALFELSSEFVPFQPLRVAFLTTAGVGAAAVVFAIVARRSDRPARTFRRIAAVAFVLSIVPNVALALNPEAAPFPDASATGFLVLIIFHVVAAVISVILLPRLTLS